MCELSQDGSAQGRTKACRCTASSSLSWSEVWSEAPSLGRGRDRRVGLVDGVRAGIDEHPGARGKVPAAAPRDPAAERRHDTARAAEARVSGQRVRIVERLELRDLAGRSDKDQHVMDDGSVSRLRDETGDIASCGFRPVEQEATVLVGNLHRRVRRRDSQVAVDARQATGRWGGDGCRIGRIALRRSVVEPGEERGAVLLGEGAIVVVLRAPRRRWPGRHPAGRDLLANELLPAEEIGIGLERKRRDGPGAVTAAATLRDDGADVAVPGGHPVGVGTAAADDDGADDRGRPHAEEHSLICRAKSRYLGRLESDDLRS